VMWAHLTSSDLYQQQSTNGAIAGVDFQVSCFARLN